MQKEQLLSKLESLMPFLSSTEQKLGHYILQNPQKILSMSTKELAQKSGVSEATLIRFTRKLNLNGYSEFKLMLSADLATDIPNSVPVSVTPDDSPLEIYKKLAVFTTMSIESTAKTLKHQDLENAVEMIYQTSKRKNRIYLSGFGASSILVKELQIKFMRLNIPVIYFDDFHLQLESHLSITKDDLLICFTTLGRSVHSHQLIQIANEKLANIILITQYGNEKLAKKATITLYTSSVENNYRLASQTAIIVQSMIIDTIFLSLAAKDFSRIIEEVDETKKSFDRFGYYAT